MTPDEILELRCALGLTQTEFAVALVGPNGRAPSDNTVQRWEVGKSKPSPLFAYRLKQLAKERKE